MAKFTVKTCVRLPRMFHQGVGVSLPWYNYVTSTGVVPAEYHIYLEGMVDVNGVSMKAIGTIYAPAGSAKAGEEFVGNKLPFFPEGEPQIMLTNPKENDYAKSVPIREDGNPMTLTMGDTVYQVPESAIRAVYTVQRYWIDLDPDEIIIKSKDGKLMRTSEDDAVFVKIALKSDFDPRLNAPIKGVTVSKYEVETRNKIRVQLHTRSVNVIRGKVTFK